MAVPLVYLEDYYLDQHGNTVFTEAYHLKRGTCCGNNCLHCPYDGISVLDGKSVSTETAIQCPFCNESFSIPMFKEEGILQEFVYDCEICCRPIDIIADYSEGSVPKVLVGR